MQIKRLDDLSEPLRRIGAYVQDEIQDNFKAQGRPRWQRLSPRYAAWKRRKVGNKPILEFTGQLKRGFRLRVGPHYALIVNNRNVKGRYLYPTHQKGGDKLPARKMLVLGYDDRAKMSDILGDYIRNG
jgi:phage gpG-like protein